MEHHLRVHGTWENTLSTLVLTEGRTSAGSASGCAQRFWTEKDRLCEKCSISSGGLAGWLLCPVLEGNRFGFLFFSFVGDFLERCGKINSILWGDKEKGSRKIRIMFAGR